MQDAFYVCPFVVCPRSVYAYVSRAYLNWLAKYVFCVRVCVQARIGRTLTTYFICLCYHYADDFMIELTEIRLTENGYRLTIILIIQQNKQEKRTAKRGHAINEQKQSDDLSD